MRGLFSKFFGAFVSVICLFLATQVRAQLPNDADNLYGDSLRPSVNIKAKLKSDQTPVCIPGGTRMTVLGQNQASLFVKLKLGDDRKECDGLKELSEQVAYEVAKTEIGESGTSRTGITYGTLVVPFKYQTTGAKDFTGSASIGGYAGYRFESLRRLGFTATPIAFMGASNISVPAGAASASENVMGFSYGVGFIGTFKGSFQTGLVVGWDRVGKSVGYQYNGKPWIALEIGYAFLQ